MNTIIYVLSFYLVGLAIYFGVLLLLKLDDKRKARKNAKLIARQHEWWKARHPGEPIPSFWVDEY